LPAIPKGGGNKLSLNLGAKLHTTSRRDFLSHMTYSEPNAPFEDVYTSVKRLQTSMGMQRIRLGALLCVLQQSGEWEGRSNASSFRRFLIEEGIEPKAAYQYMRVADAFVLRLRLPTDELRKLAAASMRVLVAAAQVANPENALQLVDIVSSMPRPEALETIAQYFGDTPAHLPEGFSRPVATILDKVGELTLDDKALLYQKLRIALPANARQI
jgi:hypothetical protein